MPDPQWESVSDHAAPPPGPPLPAPGGGTGQVWESTTDHTPDVLSDPRSRYQYTTPEGVPVFLAPQDTATDALVKNPVRQAVSAGYGAKATADKLTANLFHLLDVGASHIADFTGTEKGGLFKQVEDWARQQQQQQEQAAEEWKGGRDDMPSQLIRSGVGALLQLPQYAVATHLAGPVAGMAAMGGLEASDKGWKEALQAAAEGAALGKTFQVMGPGSRPIRLAGAALTTFAQNIAQGADFQTALTNALTMGGMNAMAPGGATARDIAQANVEQRVLPTIARTFQSRLNPVQQAGVDFLTDEGVPVRAGTATGNKFLKSAEAVTAATPLGEPQAWQFNRGTEEGLRRVAGNLAEEAHYDPASPESAGAEVKKALAGDIKDIGKSTAEAYNDAWQGRGKAEYDEEVPLRTDPDGKIVTGKVNMPVDMRDLKQSAFPIWDQMRIRMTPAEQNSSAGFHALDYLLHKMPDHVSAWQAEDVLSGLKSMARTETESGVRDRSQGIGAHLIPELQRGIDAAVAKTGQGALEGLREGRRQHAHMMDVADLADSLSNEPVQAFGKLKWANDSGIEYLRKIANQVPDVMPRVGRAYVQQLFDLATQEGGFTRAVKILRQWQSLGPETKKILFPNPLLRSKLDNFFTGATLVAEQVNPSGTEITRQATSVNPLRWLAGYAGGKLLFTPKGVALLTEAMKVPPESQQGRSIRAQLQGMLGKKGPEDQTPPPTAPTGGGPEPPEGGTPRAGEQTPPTPTGGAGEQTPPPTGEGTPPSGLTPQGYAQWLKDRAGEFFSSEEGASPRRRPADPISAVALKYLMENPLKIKPTGKEGDVLTSDMGNKLRTTARAAGGVLDRYSDEGRRQARAELAMAQDLEYALASQPEARGWYSDKVKAMEDILTANRPEFKDPGKMSLFKFLLGITSNGVDPELNFDAAVRGWDLYKKHGHFMAYDPDRPSEFADKPGKEDTGTGLTFRANSYKTAMATLDRLVQEKTEAGAAEWLRTKHPISELKQYDKDIYVGDGEPRYGSYVLGPKVGAFGMNLNGVYTELTADKWWSRTWNRWMGTTMATNKAGEYQYNKKTGEQELQDDPRNEGERDLMKRSAANVASQLNLSVAELQAVLWYAEQQLYRAHGLEAGSADYEMAAKTYFGKNKGTTPAAAPPAGKPVKPKPPSIGETIAGVEPSGPAPPR